MIKLTTKKMPAKKEFLNLRIFLKIFLIFLFFLTLPGISVYKPPKVLSEVDNIKKPTAPALIPQNKALIQAPLLSAEGVIVLDLPSMVVIYEKNKDKMLSPASTTKIVTALVAKDYYKDDDILEVKTLITEGRIMGLKFKERISAENLIYGALVHSANDAAYTLAENYPGGVSAFVDKMNLKVKELNLKNTHFVNPIGFEDPQQYTTAYDLAQISRLLLLNSDLKRIISTKLISVPDETYTTYHTLENVNTLLGRIPGVAGVKTGWTEEAGEVLSTLVKRNDKEVLVVVLKSKDRFGETELLINWIFSNFSWIDIKPTGPTNLH